MNNNLELLDRINDLETTVIDLQQEIIRHKKTRQTSSHSLSRGMTHYTFFLVPIIFVVILLLGLDFNHESNNSKVSYNSKGLLEVTLLVITSVSGGYVAKKIHDDSISH